MPLQKPLYPTPPPPPQKKTRPQVVDILESCPPAEHAWPLRMFLKGPPPHGRDFLRFAKFGVLQYSVIKPLVATLYLILASVGLYKEVRVNSLEGAALSTGDPRRRATGAV